MIDYTIVVVNDGHLTHKGLDMSDFLNDIQCDELVNGQSFDGQYVPTEQDLADMNEAWGDENFFCANCGHVELVGYALSPDSSLCRDCYDDCAGYDYYDETYW